MFAEYQITSCQAYEGYKLQLTFADGKKGSADLSHLVGKGVFSLWNDPKEFAKVSIDPITKTVSWGNVIDLDPVTLREKTVE